MPIELARRVASEFVKAYPTRTYLALPREAGSVSCSGRDLCWDTESETYVKRLNVSPSPRESGGTGAGALAVAVGDSSLKSLVHRLVFETRDMSLEVRRDALVGALKEMLPDYCRHVHIWAMASTERPYVYGPHKGEAVFLEPEFGDHVYILLT